MKLIASKESLTGRVRESLGLSQRALAQAVGKSYQSIRLYEGGKQPPKQVLQIMAALCMENGLSDLREELMDGIFGPKRDQTVERKNALESTRMYAFLDVIIDNADPETLRAVDRFLQITSQWCAAKSPGDVSQYLKKSG